ncbi:hypothetical protein ACFZC6_01860 [Streptomyces ossamyceticus]|uniref:hypothetical protein n=1 Tax=Streptomyces ossamyceticus TaxID=249581 RepID=UPI0036E2753C
MTTTPMPAERLNAIEAAITAGTASADDMRALLAETKRARTDADEQHSEALGWRESYRLAKGLSDDELNAMVVVDEVSKAHPAPCWFPHETCVCPDA